MIHGKRAIVDKHNELRRKVAGGGGTGAAGGGTLPAGTIGDLEWDDNLAAGAQT